jgi:UDP-2-acetamido-3-amino-2,3-dideoxy-glucuronate N-acetyltransferase
LQQVLRDNKHLIFIHVRLKQNFMKSFIHPSAEVSSNAHVGENVKIWNQVQIREYAIVGENSVLGKNVYIDFGVKIGSNCRIQNNCSIYHGVEIEDGVFVGPNVVFTNDKNPRAINQDGTPKSGADWVAGKIRVKYGASIGAHSVILPDVVIGRYAMIGAGSVVTKNVPDFGLVIGNPAKFVGYVDESGKVIKKI